VSLELASIPIASAAVSFSFAAMVLRQFLRSRKLYHLFWTEGLLLFSIASLAEAAAEIGAWNVPLYKFYYAMTPTLVALLGLGTVYLLSEKRIGHGFLAYISVVVAVFVYFLAIAPVDASQFDQGLFIGGAGLPSSVRLFSPLLTIPGSVALIGGALYSWWRVRATYNLFIAGGALIMFAGGAGIRFGVPVVLPLSLLVGIIVMYVGFIKSAEVPRPSREAKETPDAVGQNGD
jgi:hypothetical protein